jgi:hypothetical protein
MKRDCLYCLPQDEDAAAVCKDRAWSGTLSRTPIPSKFQTDLRREPAMNYKLAIIVLGVVMFIVAMIPYAYKPRCLSPDCPPEAPYFGERGNR